MLIYEPEREITIEEIKINAEELKKALPNIYFPDYINFCFTPGKITGYKNKGLLEKNIDLYTEYKIAVISKEFPDEFIESLQKIGYNICSKKMAFHWNGNPRITSEEILWDKLRNGKGFSIIKKRLEDLLVPILSSLKNIKEYRFSIYNPFIVESTDNVIPPYIEYDEIFSLPTYDNGLVNIEKLLEKIRVMPSKRALAISSEVKTNQGKKHIPMIDFKSTDLELWEIEKVIKRLQIPEEFLVNSGNSFHHHNTRELMCLDEFYNYADKIAEQPEIGKNWPWLSAHQGFSLLRISPSAKKPFFPIIEKT